MEAIRTPDKIWLTLVTVIRFSETMASKISEYTNTDVLIFIKTGKPNWDTAGRCFVWCYATCFQRYGQICEIKHSDTENATLKVWQSLDSFLQYTYFSFLQHINLKFQGCLALKKVLEILVIFDGKKKNRKKEEIYWSKQGFTALNSAILNEWPPLYTSVVRGGHCLMTETNILWEFSFDNVRVNNTHWISVGK